MMVRDVTLGLEISSALMWIYVFLNSRFAIKTTNVDDIGVAKKLISVVVLITAGLTASSLINIASKQPVRYPTYIIMIMMVYSIMFACGFSLVVHFRKKSAMTRVHGNHLHLVHHNKGRTAA